ncbi:MAG: type II toxin-antitoxin system prevent-host-death family antitoxin [Gammaproteobacteria bacterium]|nr:type II toxin-antitoxin system prevent-host-death family antitoxin [Gammaproteobacteria bacterium]MXW46234.1 type II toxin-antitoxin system prevent-host-death family antitoxin [Gammaproteobacteria bacterium]MYD00877.1 type II toxin-antitoxin system prevent-host-death family antitoxin [Gammaproteobacteria bacterium]MYI24971.1 type II toxin-antitoxin system prevent-host-death family antitoxin [Gammaproteobacteria bacterium]
MNEITATQAKAHLAEILRSVESGETIAITRHGKTIAHLVPAISRKRDARQAAVDRFEERRERWKRVKASRNEILAWRHEDHRF